MTWLDAGHPVAALASLIAGCVVGWFVPRLIARLPEPEPDPDDQDDQGEPDAGAVAKAPKPLYVDLAARPRLAAGASLASGLGAAVLGATVGWHWPLLFLVPLAPVCVALGFIDWRTRLLPSRLLLPAHAVVIVLAGVAALLDDDVRAWVRALIAMLVVRSVFWVLWWIRSAGMGFGDVRLSALLAFALGYLGWAEVAVGIYAGFLVFVAPGIVVAIVRRDRGFLKARLPFGPFLVLGALIGAATGSVIATSLGY